MKILGFLFAIIIAVLLFGLNIIVRIVKGILGLGSSTTSKNSARQNNTTIREDANTQKKKIFSKEEGEYVDFEEVIEG